VQWNWAPGRLPVLASANSPSSAKYKSVRLRVRKRHACRKWRIAAGEAGLGYKIKQSVADIEAGRAGPRMLD